MPVYTLIFFTFLILLLFIFFIILCLFQIALLLCTWIFTLCIFTYCPVVITYCCINASLVVFHSTMDYKHTMLSCVVDLMLRISIFKCLSHIPFCYCGYANRCNDLIIQLVLQLYQKCIFFKSKLCFVTCCSVLHHFLLPCDNHSTFIAPT